MAETGKQIRLSKAAKEFNIGISTIVDYLKKKGITIESNPNTKLARDIYDILLSEFQSEKDVKQEADKIGLEYTEHQTVSIDDKVGALDETETTKEQDELFIKDASSFEYDGSVKTTAPKPEEIKPVEEPVVDDKIEETVAEADPVVETTKVIAEEKVEVKPVEKIEEKPVEEVKPAEVVPEKPIEKAEVPVDKVEEKDAEKGDLKILGKIDLDKIASKPRKQKKKPKEKVKKAPVVEKTEEKVPEEKSDTAEEVVVPVKEEVKTDTTVEIKKEVKPKEEDSNFIKTKVEKLSGPTILGSIKLPEVKKPEKKKPVASSSDDLAKAKKKKRRRIKKTGETTAQPDARKKERPGRRFKDKTPVKEHSKPDVTDEEIQKQIKDTLQRLSSGGKSKGSKHRRIKRELLNKQRQEEEIKQEEDKKIIKVTEFVTANELASMMSVQVNEIISTCMSLGLFVSINQRLDAETLSLVAEEFGFEVEFVSVEVQEAIELTEEVDLPEDLEERAPIVTVMGHVDHGKTSLLDYIRDTNVIAGESGGITQHIGAYEVKLDNEKTITFLDTPGHEAFTAMRARGAKITDVAIIVIAADDDIMPQTIEAINHAQAAGVPIVFAINKIDKPNSNPEKIREQLSKINILVEEWGGKYQAQEISAKKGTNIDELLEKVLLEAEMLELKGNPHKSAHGAVLESSLDKGRGFVANILIQDGTLRIGDIVLAGATYGRVKAMYNERNTRLKSVGPSAPVLLLGLNGAPQPGDQFNVISDEKEAKIIATKRLQLQREQGMRTQKHITLDEIGRRIAIGDFKELNIIIKGDVDGSVEALSDSLLKLSTEQVQVNVIHKSVGQVTESDVLLASASNAVIVSFQVRPSMSARKLAEQEQIDIRIYSIIYDAINEIKDAIEGMLSPEIKEKIVCNLEIRETFKITKVGTIAGCMVLDGKITRNTRIRLIRDGIVVYEGELGSLKRFKDDVREVATGYECGLNITNYNDIKVGDIIEGFEEIEVKRKL